MLLLGSYYSPFARRVGAALIARDIPFTHNGVNVFVDPAPVAAVNPLVKIPVLQLDSGEALIDSMAIVDHLNEQLGPDRALVPPSGAERRSVLRLVAIAGTVCEQIIAWEEELRRTESQPKAIARHRRAITNGFAALDAASGQDGVIGRAPLDLATISAYIAYDYYVGSELPERDGPGLAPRLAAVVARLANDPAFARTRFRS
ncbi:glutathione S-transferase family protein [Bradyrhizobium sp. 2TAF24]|uniref:glutathione S-transferase family protein n=1 Tax=Bradyrhizobium sp. 2TAF24 TaxID=3233011 RepID=UPI003F90990B